MSTPATGGGGGQQRELVFCHPCGDEWYRDDHGIICPQCGSDFVEIIENDRPDPSDRSPRIPGGYHSYDSSDGEDETDGGHSHTFSSTFLFEAPGIRIQRTTGSPLPPMGSAGRADRTGTGENGYPGGPAPNMVEMLQTIFSSIMGEQGMERARQQAQGEPGDHASGNAAGAAGGDHAPQDPRGPGGPGSPPHPPFPGFFPSQAGSRFVYERHHVPPRAVVDDLPSFLQQLFGGTAPFNDPGAGVIHHILGMPGPGGDYVWTEGQLDRVISELMEQHQGNAPPPAPPEVLNNLPKIKVDQKRVMEGEDCAVCKEDLVLNEEVAQLPCRHVYHEDCIKRWLESRDTCPICRASTAGAARPQQGPQSSQQQQQHQQQQQQHDGQQSQQQGSSQRTGRWFLPRNIVTTTSTTNSNNNGGPNRNGPQFGPGGWRMDDSNNGGSR